MSLFPIKNKKILFLDCETGGILPEKFSIFQLSGIVSIDGTVYEEFDFVFQPKKRIFSKMALEIHKFDPKEYFKDLMSYEEAFKQFIEVLDTYVDRYNKKDRFIIVGQNPDFDLKHLEEFFKENNDPYMWSWFSYRIDLIQIVTFMLLNDLLDIDKLIEGGDCLQLWNIAKYYNLSFNHHSALEDIKITKKIYDKCVNIIKGKQ